MPNALEVSLFDHEPDGDYESHHFASQGINGMWTVSVPSHDLIETTYYILVKGTDGKRFVFTCALFQPTVKWNRETKHFVAVAEVRFRIVAVLVDSKLVLGHRHHGELNENEWLYFTFNKDDISAVNNSSGRLLEDKAVHLSISLWKYSGAVFLRPARGKNSTTSLIFKLP